MTLLAAVLGLIAGYLVATGDAGPGLAAAILTALFAALSCAVFCDVKLGASRRVGSTSPEGRDGTGTLGALMVAGAIVLAALTLLFEPIGLVAAIGVAWLAIARRRKADRKHAGLRSLR